jgi:hypothetical protein
VILNSSTNFDINEHTMWVFSLLPTSPWITNDVITVNSDIKKSVSYTRLTVNGLVTIGLADSIAQDSNWPIMFPGENRFCFQESNYLEFVSFEYTPAFWGV